MINTTQQDIVKETVQFFINKANDTLCTEDKETLCDLNIGYDLRGTTAGTANFYNKTVKFNKVLIEENFNNFIDNVIPHEVAHVVTQHFFGSRTKSHGKEWKYVMKHIFGVEPTRCHSMNTKNSISRNTKKFIYTCPCENTFNISTQRHNKIKQGYNRICGSCNGRLIFTGKQTDKVTLMAQAKG